MSLSQDQYKFLMANLAGLSLALPYRYIPKSFRNEFNYLPGILMLFYCFGRQANSLVLFSAISYAICRYTPRAYVQRVTLCSSLVFLSYAHLSRQIIDYGGYVLDISGPFMIAVQKMTSLGFCLYDGRILKDNLEAQELSSIRKSPNSTASAAKDSVDSNNNINKNGERDIIDEDGVVENGSITSSVESRSVIDARQKSDVQGLTEEQKRFAVLERPNFSQFMGYFFHFPTVLCGPIGYYNDYSEFVDTPPDKSLPPGRHLAVAKKLLISITCTILHLTLNPRFEIDFLRSAEFLIHTPLLIRFYYILIFTMLSRLKYYVAWHLGEALSNASGFGFSGYDANGKPKWDLISNMDLWKFETSLNFRDAIHAWNKTTQNWLRRTAYERAPRKLAVLSTYMLSAIWHGFYPGYYMTFLTGAMFTYASRNARFTIRPHFQRGTILPKVYDVITFTLTRLSIAYVAFPFVILDFRNSYAIYKSLHYSIHLLAVGGLLLGLFVDKKTRPSESRTVVNNGNNKRHNE